MKVFKRKHLRVVGKSTFLVHSKTKSNLVLHQICWALWVDYPDIPVTSASDNHYLSSHPHLKSCKIHQAYSESEPKQCPNSSASDRSYVKLIYKIFYPYIKKSNFCTLFLPSSIQYAMQCQICKWHTKFRELHNFLLWDELEECRYE